MSIGDSPLLLTWCEPQAPSVSAWPEQPSATPASSVPVAIGDDAPPPHTWCGTQHRDGFAFSPGTYPPAGRDWCLSDEVWGSSVSVI